MNSEFKPNPGIESGAPKENQDYNTTESEEKLENLENEWEQAEIERIKSVAETNKEGLPPLKIEVFFAPHASAEDAEGLEKSFSKADVFIPESAGNTASTLNEYQDLSFGRITPDELIAERSYPKDYFMYGFMKKHLDMVYKSYKPIAIVDVPKGDIRYEEINAHYKSDTNIIAPSLGANFNTMVSAIKARIKKEAELHIAREDYMLSNLHQKIKEAIENRPDLQAKSQLNILMFLGMAHTRVYHQLKKFKQDATRTFRTYPAIYDYGAEGLRRYTLDKEISPELAAKIILESYFGGRLHQFANQFTTLHEDRIRFVRKLLSKFSTDEIKALFNMTEDDALNEFQNQVRRKNGSFPKSVEEFTKFINEP